MEVIELTQIKKINKRIHFLFTASEGLSDYFSGKTFSMEYPVTVERVPDSVAAIPFVCSVLPIIWLTDSVLRVKELDRAFYDCIPNVRSGYEKMFPESVFAGQILVDRLVDCDIPANGGSAAFFSGGLDAVHTLINHLDERPALISIWGSDIRYDNVQGWELVHSGIAEYAQKYELPDVVIRSTFREFDNESVLHQKFAEQLKDSWWHGVKHGLALLGHAAPYAYLHGISKVYIASSNCPADGPVRCASHPSTDNHVRFGHCRVIHDSFESSRQDKVHDVVCYSRETGISLPLHVCWESQSGGNCCVCEKCYRTIAGIVAEGADPVAFGFLTAPETIPQMQMRMIGWGQLGKGVAQRQWVHIHNRMAENRKKLAGSPYWKDIYWIAEADFTRLETVKMPLHYRIRRHLSQYRFYQLLHRIKEKL